MTKYPDPLTAALLCETAGAAQITVHLREDRRHIQESDVRLMRKTLQTELNLEMAATDEMMKLARDIKPNTVTLVPERRQELTTEGGLDVIKGRKKIAKVVSALTEAGLRVSLFIDPAEAQIDAALLLGVKAVELHTGRYSDAKDAAGKGMELATLKRTAGYGQARGLTIVAGHGLNYDNIKPVVSISEIVEFNIGHSIIARALTVGIEKAVAEMVRLVTT